jgi:hypothetical protein
LRVVRRQTTRHVQVRRDIAGTIETPE